MIFTPELLKKVAELRIHTRRGITSLLSGNYRSSFRGSGMQFKEFRHYEPGDDIRHMSWQVTARTGRPTLKTFEEERELNVLLMVDVSGSSLLGSTQKRKIDMYAELVALLGLAAVKSGDNVGLLLFDDKPGLYWRPHRSRNQILNLVSNVLDQKLTGKKSDIRSALAYAQNVLKNRSLIIIVSDFLVPPFEVELVATSRRNEIILLHCTDDAERGKVESGVYEVWDPETRQFHLLDGNSRKVREEFSKYYENFTEELKQVCQRTKSDLLSLSVEDDYLQKLVHFFKYRGPSRL